MNCSEEMELFINGHKLKMEIVSTIHGDSLQIVCDSRLILKHLTPNAILISTLDESKSLFKNCTNSYGD